MSLKSDNMILGHAWFDKDIDTGLFDFLSVAIEAQEFLVIAHILARTVVDFLKGYVDCN